MKRLALILLCAALLCGCTPKEIPATEPTVPATREQETIPAATQPAQTQPPETMPRATEPVQTEAVEMIPVQAVP